MPVKISTPPMTEYYLVKTDAKYGDDAKPTIVFIRTATQGDEEARGRLFATVKKEILGDKSFFVSDVSIDDVYRQEVFLTLAFCNINWEKEDQPLFSFEKIDGVGRISMTESRFDEAWGKLPFDIASEIIECVHRQNPQWIE